MKCSYEIFDPKIKKTRSCLGKVYVYCYKHDDYVCIRHYPRVKGDFGYERHNLTKNLKGVKMTKKKKKKLVKLIFTIPLLASFGYSANKHWNNFDLEIRLQGGK